MTVHMVVLGQIKRNKMLHDGQKAPSVSVGSRESVSTGPSTIRKSIESGPQRFLGRFPPPIQRRSASLPRIDEWKPPHRLRSHPPMEFASPPRRVYDQLLLLALAGLNENTFMNWARIEEPYIRKLMNKRAIMVLLLTVLIGVCLIVLFIFAPGHRLQSLLVNSGNGCRLLLRSHTPGLSADTVLRAYRDPPRHDVRDKLIQYAWHGQRH